MKEFIEKLIGRLEEAKVKSNIFFNFGNETAYDDAIGIVNQLAEEYLPEINVGNNDSWIPCSEQEEPTENGKYLVYVQHYSNKDLYDMCMVDWFGEWKVSYEWNVIAWMPVAPYQPKGEWV